MLRMPRRPALDAATLDGIARTLSQLRALGLVAVVVVDAAGAGRQALEDEALRLARAVDACAGRPGARLAGNLFARRPSDAAVLARGLRVDDAGLLRRALRHNMVVVAPSLARGDDLSAPRPADPHEAVLALTRFLTGMQFDGPDGDGAAGDGARPRRIASVERLIILDPLGGIPLPGRPDLRHQFVNLEQEYGGLVDRLQASQGSSRPELDGTPTPPGPTHAENLRLAREVLSLLPSSSSVLITTPVAAANLGPPAAPGPPDATAGHGFGFAQMVTTRRQRNPLLHNLLTDKPVSSPSLPLKRIREPGPGGHDGDADRHAATLVKRGLPVTIYPDPRAQPWRPPRPGSARLRLTDTCIDLPRLVHLIEDSFGRRLDVQAYVDRVNESLAGVVVAGEYDGGAIFTWERPAGVDERDAYAQGRLVPYLDKFAVLRRLQGGGGVADVVFNAMVHDCLPRGVCWRSRVTNPVNRWYFERSAGTYRLAGSDWTMFWTTLALGNSHPVLRDYEAVCRGVQPSWADDGPVVD